MDHPANWIGVVALAISMVGTVASAVLAYLANNNRQVAALEKALLRQEYELKHTTARLEQCEERHKLAEEMDRATMRKVEMLDLKVDSALGHPPGGNGGTPPQ